MSSLFDRNFFAHCRSPGANLSQLLLLLFFGLARYATFRYTVTTVTIQLKFLPVLWPADQRSDGIVVGDARHNVRVIHHGGLDDLLRHPGQFRRKYGEIGKKQQRTIKGLLLLWDAVRTKDQRMVDDLAREIVRLMAPTEEEERQAGLWEVVKRRPVDFLEGQLGSRLKNTKLILWRQRERRGNLAIGILCESLVDAVYVLTAFRATVGHATSTGSCVICHRVFVRERGARRQTCSDKCRKKKSRLQRRRGRTRRRATRRTAR